MEYTTFECFRYSVRGGKTFAAEQKIRELKKRIFRFKSLNKKNKIRAKSNEIIRKVVNNMNKTPSEKYGIKPETVERESLLSEPFKMKFEFDRLKKMLTD